MKKQSLLPSPAFSLPDADYLLLLLQFELPLFVLFELFFVLFFWPWQSDALFEA